MTETNKTKPNIGPQVWGPHGWQFIHYITLGYPNNPTFVQKQNYKNFFLSLSNVLPCSICAAHYNENIIKYPLTDEILSSRRNLTFWAIDIHNLVNEFNGKPILNYDDALKLIGSDEKCSFIENNKNYILFISVFIALVGIAIVYKKR